MSQGAQAVGMGKEAQNVPTAAELYKKANDILGYHKFFINFVHFLLIQ